MIRSLARIPRRGRFAALALALPALAFAAGCAGAPGRPTPQRPTYSNTTATTAAGTLELEAGVAVDPGDTFNSPVTLKYGVSEDTELFGSMAPYVWEDFDGPNGEGVGDLYLGVRQRFIDVGADEPTFAYQLQTKIPTAPEDQGIGSGQMDFFAAGIMDYPIEEIWLTSFYQLGIIGEPNGTDDPDIQHGLAFASSASIDDALGLFGEIAGVFTPERDDEQVFATAGLTHVLGERSVIDGGVLVGLSRDAPDFQILLGITTNFGGGGQQPSRREPRLPPTAPID